MPASSRSSSRAIASAPRDDSRQQFADPRAALLFDPEVLADQLLGAERPVRVTTVDLAVRVQTDPRVVVLRRLVTGGVGARLPQQPAGPSVSSLRAQIARK